MDFGTVPTKRAAGAILAHSVRAGETRLRKGLLLEPAHIEQLADAGIAEVVVARLGEDDVHEDEAAERIAAALVPDPEAAGLTLSRPFTGRVNLLAAGPGVVEMDRAALDRLNRINAMITLATVPAYQQMTPGGMVGTVKIISYGVPARDVAAACEAAQGAIRLRAPRLGSASLIITETPGGAGAKGQRAIADRVAALGMELVDTCEVPHDTAPLARAVAEAGGDMVLILTASATSDAHDVAPEALRRAGGTVTRFGMPVDPGNLLFLGNLESRPVIGLPGCARSPALNGADWVLSRIACGIEVSPEDIAAMGVGGLLKEIPTRPQPRAGRKAR